VCRKWREEYLAKRIVAKMAGIAKKNCGEIGVYHLSYHLLQKGQRQRQRKVHDGGGRWQWQWW
jgi:hypothetical protein